MSVRGQTYAVATNLVTEQCITCGVLFAIPQELYERRREDHRSFYCPNGHSQHYAGETEAEQLRRQLQAQRNQATALRSSLDQETARANHEASRAAGYKGALTKAKRRVGRGVCPVDGCKRHFENLKRHMATEHPDYPGED